MKVILFMFFIIICYRKSFSSEFEPEVTRTSVIFAYQLILGREPESEEVITYHMTHSNTLSSLRSTFFDSEEFKKSIIKRYETMFYKALSLNREYRKILEQDYLSISYIPCSDAIIFSSPIYMGQDEEVATVGIQIHLNEDNLIYESLCWHYRMGIRHFYITYDKISQQSRDKIKLFHSRVYDICTLNLCEFITDQKMIFPENVQWILTLNSRQFLSLSKNINFLLDFAELNNVLLSVLPYCGIDNKNNNINIPIDESLTYRQRDLSTTISLSRKNTVDEFSSMQHIIYKDGFVAEYCTSDKIVFEIDDLYYQPLPMTKVIVDSINHACSHVQQEYPVPKNEHEKKILEFSNRFCFPHEIKFANEYIFTAVPKCGCSTVLNALESFQAGRKLSKVYYDGFHNIKQWAHNRYERLLDPKVFKFAVIRNPYTRILSAFLDQIDGNDEGKIQNRRFLGIKDDEAVTFLLFLNKIKEKDFNLVDSHFRPIHLHTMSQVVPYDFFIRFENFSYDFSYVLDILKIGGAPEDYHYAPHATNSNAKLLKYYNPETEEGRECIELVRKIYAKDFELYGYSTELPVGDVSPAGLRLFCPITVERLVPSHTIIDFSDNNDADVAESLVGSDSVNFSETPAAETSTALIIYNPAATASLFAPK